jgi:hypothetical protein
MLERIFKTYSDIGTGLFMILNALILILVRDLISAELAALSFSQSSQLIIITGFMYRMLAEMTLIITSIDRVFQVCELEQEKFEGDHSFEITKGHV